jgi:hypothetical protein
MSMQELSLRRRGLFSLLPTVAVAGLLPSTVGAIEQTGDEQNQKSVGLAAPTAPQGASGGPVNSPNRNVFVGSNGDSKINYVGDNSPSFRVIRTEDGLFFGIRVQNIEHLGGDGGPISNDAFGD